MKTSQNKAAVGVFHYFYKFFQILDLVIRKWEGWTYFIQNLDLIIKKSEWLWREGCKFNSPNLYLQNIGSYHQKCGWSWEGFPNCSYYWIELLIIWTCCHPNIGWNVQNRIGVSLNESISNNSSYYWIFRSQL